MRTTWRRFLLLTVVAVLASCMNPDNPLVLPGVSSGTGTSHDVDLGGVFHATDYCDPFRDCTSCHGASLEGSGAVPACTTCHGALWESCGSNVTHDVSLGGVNHADGYCDPFNRCASCHGSDLSGGTNGEPSCFSCHAALWETCGAAGHTEDLGGIFHAPGYCDPYTACGSCHGVDLSGGTNGEPSCTTCHGAEKWRDCGSVVHDRVEDGVAHASDWCVPFQDCSPCHGVDLTGGANGEPSCYECHGAKWEEECGGDDI